MQDTQAELKALDMTPINEVLDLLRLQLMHDQTTEGDWRETARLLLNLQQRSVDMLAEAHAGHMELMHIAAMVGESSDPHAAWESVQHFMDEALRAKVLDDRLQQFRVMTSTLLGLCRIKYGNLHEDVNKTMEQAQKILNDVPVTLTDSDRDTMLKELAMLVKRLCRHNTNKSHVLTAHEYLARKGLVDPLDILREE